MKGLTGNTAQIFESIKGLDILKEYLLVGGTALGIQIGHRLSEDLDFCKWQDEPSLKNKKVQWTEIESELKKFGDVRTEILDFYQVLFYLDEVKLSFYSNGIANSRDIVSGMSVDNVRIADLRSLGTMKLEVMSRRFLFRDYYDVYAILREGTDIREIIKTCGRYSRHRMKSKMMMSILSNGSLFRYEEGFELLKPRYKVNSKDIEAYMRERIREAYGRGQVH